MMGKKSIFRRGMEFEKISDDSLSKKYVVAMHNAILKRREEATSVYRDFFVDFCTVLSSIYSSRFRYEPIQNILYSYLTCPLPSHHL